MYICTDYHSMKMNYLKRIYIWCRRFRYRKGYGVHSPFAYGLITDVIYEKLPYYAYDELCSLHGEISSKALHYSERVNRLLMRLVNYFRPSYILEIGTGAGLSICYMAAGRLDAQCVSLCGNNPSKELINLIDRCKNANLAKGPELKVLDEELKVIPEIGMLHIAHTEDYECVFEKILPYVGEKTLCVIEGIHDTAIKYEWWKRVVADKRTGITFDLYELGLVFFDHAMNKQQYIVNFSVIYQCQ